MCLTQQRLHPPFSPFAHDQRFAKAEGHPNPNALASLRLFTSYMGYNGSCNKWTSIKHSQYDSLQCNACRLWQQDSYTCMECHAVLPTSHLLDIHLAEVHDSFFQAQVQSWNATWPASAACSYDVSSQYCMRQVQQSSKQLCPPFGQHANFRIINATLHQSSLLVATALTAVKHLIMTMSDEDGRH